MEETEPDAAADDPGDELRRARPPVDTLAMESSRARAARALFGAAEPARLGRFVLLGPIAGGGMGVVHGAYDAQLDRRVALKLLHPRLHGARNARDRLIAEARALARLDHPNVVPVHDVIEIDGQIVIVMEFVDGRSLEVWAREQPRTWREIVTVYVEAGRGLAAAHALGVVHRDFKPANAILGDDGRVRVLDFGLARSDREADAVLDEVRPPPPPGLTATGEVVGTMAYTALEQLAGEVATPASDQFSFCVALYRALHGVPPFTGDDAPSLAASIRAGRIARSENHGVPAWLDRVVVRGLMAHPAERFSSMHALLDELGRERGWRRWRFAIAGALMLIVAATTVAIALMRETDPLASCDGGAGELSETWNPGRRAVVRAALDRVGTPYAAEAREWVLTTLDRYRDDWTAMHRNACVASREGRQSDTMLDRRMLCLDRRRDDLAAAVQVLAQIDAVTVGNAVDVTARMPAVAACGDIEALQAETEPPKTIGERNQVAALRTQLSHANALERAGRAGEALAETRAVLAAAQRIGYAPLLVEAALLAGKVLLFQRDFDAAIEPLSQAEETALAHRLTSQAVVAGARRLYVEASAGRDLAGLARKLEMLEPLSRDLPGDRFARPLLLNNVGVMYMSAGKRDLAQGYFGRAAAALVGITDPDLELNSINQNLAMVTTDPSARARLAQMAWERMRDKLGPYHLSTVQLLYSYGHYMADPLVSLPLVQQACELFENFYPELIVFRADCRCYEAFLNAELGDADTAARLYSDVTRLAGDPTLSWIRLAAGHASLHRGAKLDALSHFTSVIADFANGSAWWERQRAGHAYIGAGLAELSLGHDHVAMMHLEAAIRIFVEMTSINEDVENAQRLAFARMTLATVLRRQGSAPDRVQALEELAANYHRASSTTAYRAPHPWIPR